MSFAAPLALLALLAVPAAIAAHVLAQRRRRRYPVRYTALATLASVLPREPQWRRHAPVALFSLALAALALALARPQHTIAVPVERASVVLVTDVSRSMSAQDVNPTRLDAARNAAERFLDRVPGQLRVGLVSFSETAQTLQIPTTDHGQVRSALKTMEPIAGTSTGAGLNAALDALGVRNASSGRNPPSAIVLLSDGKANDGNAADLAAAEAKRLHVPIYTVALGTPDGTIELPSPGGGTQTVMVPPDPEALQRIAQESGGLSFRAQDSDELDAVYGRLGSQIGTKPDKAEITSTFAGIALLLLGAAVAGSLRWNGRLP
ncbi:MAG: Ca-activated chloride channel [Solirubrobacteraceae bacterium]|nr:Ca-activated chloride channel [Solirubrobacteraceae bacterium]